MAQTRGKDAILEGILNRDLGKLCELALLLGEGPATADWSSTAKSRKKYLKRLTKTALHRFAEFAEVYPRIKVPGRHAERLRALPDSISDTVAAAFLEDVDAEDWDDEDDLELELSDILSADESRLLLKWAIFDGQLEGEPASERRPRPTAPARRGRSSNRRRAGVANTPVGAGGDRGWTWFRAALADVAGLDEVKRVLYEECYLPLVDPEKLERYGLTSAGAVLMHGPPGVGKTALARAAANQAGFEFRYVSAPSLLSKWIGDAEGGLRKAFQARANGSPVLLFLDELDAIAPRRDALMAAESAYVQQLLVLLDGFEKRRNLSVVAATNRLDAIDPALVRPGRFRPMAVGLPDIDQRRRIVEIHLAGRKVTGDLKLDFIARETEEWSGAELMALCDAAARLAMHREEAEGDTQAITDADLATAWRAASRSKESSAR